MGDAGRVRAHSRAGDAGGGAGPAVRRPGPAERALHDRARRLGAYRQLVQLDGHRVVAASGRDAEGRRLLLLEGHDAPGLYAVLAGLERLPIELMHGFRRLGGLPGHPDIGTPGMVANTGSLGMGISKAKGMVTADRLKKGRSPRVFVMLGDGELQEGQIWESLAER